MEAELLHAGQRSADGRLRRWLHGDDEHQIVCVLIGLLEDRVDVDLLVGNDVGEPGDDAHLVPHQEAHEVGSLASFDANFGDLLRGPVAECGRSERAILAKVARGAHDVADDGHAGGRACAAAAVERVLAVLALHPDCVVGALHLGKHRRLRDEHGAHEE